eukprot:CAMPEP_0197585084 /NCGR_PEP_ID=MMETSP1326-20131121/7490_1 /TAXON_ID=1155430 /ORGANISM="Genus nov. species nov., Strain RCC2288" /LENGTH=173 /DNA_ID=CAMNT_0043149537 /DNA_START=57 /DNA_END=578 /DNA_ORIENTATION=-
MGGPADWGIGHAVSGVTALGEAFKGEVFSYDDGMGLAVLRTQGDIINTHDVRILRVQGVTGLKSIPPAKPPVMETLPVVDEARCQKREEGAVKAAQASAANIGVGVTSEAQDIFDALARTLPCRWDSKTIVVMDDVKIAAPYKDCLGAPGGDPRAVERVQKVLAMEKSKLGLK